MTSLAFVPSFRSQSLLISSFLVLYFSSSFYFSCFPFPLRLPSFSHPLLPPPLSLPLSACIHFICVFLSISPPLPSLLSLASIFLPLLPFLLSFFPCDLPLFLIFCSLPFPFGLYLSAFVFSVFPPSLSLSFSFLCLSCLSTLLTLVLFFLVHDFSAYPPLFLHYTERGEGNGCPSTPSPPFLGRTSLSSLQWPLHGLLSAGVAYVANLPERAKLTRLPTFFRAGTTMAGIHHRACPSKAARERLPRGRRFR